MKTKYNNRTVPKIHCSIVINYKSITYNKIRTVRTVKKNHCSTGNPCYSKAISIIEQ